MEKIFQQKKKWRKIVPTDLTHHVKHIFIQQTSIQLYPVPSTSKSPFILICSYLWPNNIFQLRFYGTFVNVVVNKRQKMHQTWNDSTHQPYISRTYTNEKL